MHRVQGKAGDQHQFELIAACVRFKRDGVQQKRTRQVFANKPGSGKCVRIPCLLEGKSKTGEGAELVKFRHAVPRVFVHPVLAGVRPLPGPVEG